MTAESTTEANRPAHDWEAVIGLEVHVQLLTESKLFSSESAAFGAPPNTHVSEVCAGLPGALPVMNRRAIELALMAGFALGCKLQPRSRFARKHYFYPDLPKGYQISQYEAPLFLDGHVDYPAGTGWKESRLTRIHLEEDAGKLVHGPFHSSVDLNRAGVPLIEIVTEPDLRLPEEAVALLRELQILFRYLGVSDCNMEEGSLRCDANISVRTSGKSELTVRTEIKNLNSFRFVEKALHFEVARQIAVYQEGGQVIQETRLFDDRRGITSPMRGKEEAEDYRYFPDPDLPPLVIDTEWAEQVRGDLPETPAVKLCRYEKEFGLRREMAVQLVQARGTTEFFESALTLGAEAKSVAAWMTQYLLPAVGTTGRDSLRATGITPDDLAFLLDRIENGQTSKTTGRKALDSALKSRRPVRGLLAQMESDSEDLENEIRSAITATLQHNPDQVEEYRAGEGKILGYLMGQILQSLGGKADPIVIRRLLENALNGKIR